MSRRQIRKERQNIANAGTEVEQVCLSIGELQACVGPGANLPEQEQTSRTVRFDLGHGGQI